MTAFTTAPQGYSATQIALHWLVAVLVAAQNIFKDAISGDRDAIPAGETDAFDPLILAPCGRRRHDSCLRFMATGSALHVRRARRTRERSCLALDPEPRAQWAFYAVLAAMAATGALAWFGDVAQAAQPHDVLNVLLLALVALHVLTIPFHRILLKNDVMRRPVRSGD